MFRAAIETQVQLSVQLPTGTVVEWTLSASRGEAQIHAKIRERIKKFQGEERCPYLVVAGLSKGY